MKTFITTDTARQIRNIFYCFLLFGINLISTPLVHGQPVQVGNPPRLHNPLKDEFSSIPALLAQLLDLVVMIGVPIAILFLVYSGFLFVTARGSEDKLKKAKGILLYTMVGTGIIVGAALIAEVIEGTIDQLQG